MSLNSQLFTMENLPVKMCLHGFTYLDTLKITKLIIIHGGMVTTEPDDYTVVLSHPNCSTPTKYAKFDIKWLYDCITENKYLSAMQYMLPSSTKVENLLIRQILIMNGQQDKKTDDVNVHTNGSQMVENLVSPKKEDVGLENDMNNNEDSWAQSERLKAETSAEISLSTSVTDVDCRPVRKRRRTSTHAVYSSKISTVYASCHQVYSPAEDQQIIDYIIKNNAIATAHRMSLWKKAKAEGMFENPRRTAKALTTYFDYRLRYKIGNYVSDPAILREFEKMENGQSDRFS